MATKDCVFKVTKSLGKIGLVRSTSFGRKRVYTSDFMDVDSPVTNSTKKQCSENSFLSLEKSALEMLPQDILIRIVCGVEHEDLKSLYLVSKSINEAASIAKHWHFAYSTPAKSIGFRNPVDLVDLSELNGIQAPNAPLQNRIPQNNLCRKKLAGIAVALFASPTKEDPWSRRELHVEL